MTYSVTVHNPDTGDGKLLNVVTTPTEPNGVQQANCPTDSTDPACSTQTGVESVSSGSGSGGGGGGGTSSTGNDTQLQLLLGGLPLGAGGLLVLAGRRRRRRTA